ncbi:MAG TPA: cation transporter [Anaerolineales bacterium]|nr:cation transporter [Anaerolineales bacterium]
MSSITYKVPNISCGHCVHTIESELSGLNGVRKVEAVQTGKQVTVEYDSPATTEAIEALLDEINYPVAK